MPAGSRVVFDYMISPALLNPAERIFFDGLARRAALAGEPFQTFFNPSSLNAILRTMGFAQIEDIEPQEMDARYFGGRTDKLRFGRLAHVIKAQV